MYITSSSSISFQPTFRNKGFSSIISDSTFSSEIISPDYSAFIPPMEKRRMSDVLKMSITCSLDCIEQSYIKQPDAIIVGTSMGCCSHTKYFLDNILASKGNLLSPSSFISSTHNTIAGQISLRLKNHSYNNTHTQNSLSFEQALIDCKICINEGCRNILVGAADENENELHNLKTRLSLQDFKQAYGASFFLIGSESGKTEAISIIDVASLSLIQKLSKGIIDFIEPNSISTDQIDMVLYSHSSEDTKRELEFLFGPNKIKDYQNLSGIYFTNSAFALNYASDMLCQNTNQNKIILICNNLVPENLGLILLKN